MERKPVFFVLSKNTKSSLWSPGSIAKFVQQPTQCPQFHITLQHSQTSPGNRALASRSLTVSLPQWAPTWSSQTAPCPSSTVGGGVSDERTASASNAAASFIGLGLVPARGFGVAASTGANFASLEGTESATPNCVGNKDGPAGAGTERDPAGAGTRVEPADA